jgi:hypothetical protein
LCLLAWAAEHLDSAAGYTLHAPVPQEHLIPLIPPSLDFRRRTTAQANPYSKLASSAIAGAPPCKVFDMARELIDCHGVVENNF